MTPLERPSPNFGERRTGARPELVVLHYTAMPDADAALRRLCDPAAEVSAHYLIARDGTVLRLVGEDLRAWHAGAGSWGGAGDVNSRSIGIELDNPGDAPFAEPLMAALEALLSDVLGRWKIRAEGVIGHSDMSPGRKSDPGRRFDWRRLALAGLSVWPEDAADGGAGTAAGDLDAFGRAARRFGYPDEAASEAVLEAFRARFRPGAVGPVEAADVATAAALAAAFPIDRRRGGS